MADGLAGAVRALAKPLMHNRVATSLLGSIVAFDANRDTVVLTFDDGPDADETPEILDSLDAFGASATFFLLASQAKAHPSLVRELGDRGHEIGLHGDDHQDLSALGPRSVRDSLRRGRETLESISGQEIRWFRPPYGRQSVRSLVVTKLLGLDVVHWSSSGAEQRGLPLEEHVTIATESLHPGQVLLLHDRLEPSPYTELPARPPRPSALTRRVVEELAGRGADVVTVGMAVEAWTPIRRVWINRRISR